MASAKAKPSNPASETKTKRVKVALDIEPQSGKIKAVLEPYLATVANTIVKGWIARCAVNLLMVRSHILPSLPGSGATRRAGAATLQVIPPKRGVRGGEVIPEGDDKTHVTLTSDGSFLLLVSPVTRTRQRANKDDKVTPRDGAAIAEDILHGFVLAAHAMERTEQFKTTMSGLGFKTATKDGRVVDVANGGSWRNARLSDEARANMRALAIEHGLLDLPVSVNLVPYMLEKRPGRLNAYQCPWALPDAAKKAGKTPCASGTVNVSPKVADQYSVLCVTHKVPVVVVKVAGGFSADKSRPAPGRKSTRKVALPAGLAPGDANAAAVPQNAETPAGVPAEKAS